MTAAYPAQARHARVVHGLGAQIVRGELGPGGPVPTEDELVSQFDVGRSALREGVKVLAGKGLLESRTSAGTRVRPRESWNLLDPDVLRWRYAPAASRADVRILADLRVAMEPGAARLAAEAASAAQRAAVAAAMAGMWAAADEPAAFVEADLAFHRAVFAAAGNDLLLYVHDVVSVALGAIRPLHTRSAGHYRQTLPAHQRVATAIQRGHHRQAETAMREIVEGARDDALREAGEDEARREAGGNDARREAGGNDARREAGGNDARREAGGNDARREAGGNDARREAGGNDARRETRGGAS